MCWVAWKELAKPKKFGGLGFREIEDFNDALLGNLSWRIANNPQPLLSRILMSKYCVNSSFLKVTPSSSASHGWRSILIGRDLLLPHLIKVIGNGTNTKIWEDPWIPMEACKTPYGPATEELAQATVADLIDASSGSWKKSLIHKRFPGQAATVLCIKPSISISPDLYQWLPNKSGIYSSESGYYARAMDRETRSIGRLTNPCWIKDLWAANTSPKIKMFTWKILQNTLPTGANLQSRGLLHSHLCIHCGEQETIDHLFLRCKFAEALWKAAPIHNLSAFGEEDTFKSCLKRVLSCPNLPPSGIASTPLFPWLCWSIWLSRNQKIFENRVYSVEEGITKALVAASDWEKAQIKKLTFHPRNSIEVPIAPGSAILCTDAAWQAGNTTAGALKRN